MAAMMSGYGQAAAGRGGGMAGAGGAGGRVTVIQDNGMKHPYEVPFSSMPVRRKHTKHFAGQTVVIFDYWSPFDHYLYKNVSVPASFLTGLRSKAGWEALFAAWLPTDAPFRSVRVASTPGGAGGGARGAMGGPSGYAMGGTMGLPPGASMGPPGGMGSGGMGRPGGSAGMSGAMGRPGGSAGMSGAMGRPGGSAGMSGAMGPNKQ
jgi:hypothetical protein